MSVVEFLLNILVWRNCISRLDKMPLPGASIELIIDCSGAEQWRELFTSSKISAQYSSVQMT
jgi:hypothetical protein